MLFLPLGVKASFMINFVVRGSSQRTFSNVTRIAALAVECMFALGLVVLVCHM